MFEFGAGILVGAFALPWYVLGILVVAFLVDVGASSKDEFAAATWAIVLGLLAVSGIGWWTEGFNPLEWVWNNPLDTLTGFVAYALIGCLWSVAKWWIFLKKVHKRTEEEFQRATKQYERIPGPGPKRLDPPRRVRPSESFARYNSGRLTGWIFHWPFSVLSVVIGDLIIKFADTLYKTLYGMFERMAAARFAGYEN